VRQRIAAEDCRSCRKKLRVRSSRQIEKVQSSFDADLHQSAKPVKGGLSLVPREERPALAMAAALIRLETELEYA
jgi:hypothetical protein